MEDITRKTMPVALAAFAFSTAALAQGQRRAPPAEAYAACASKAQGDTCSVQIHDHALSGLCAADADQKLFCAPDRPPPGGPHRPPPEAIAACGSKKDGDSCSVTLPDGASRSGVCRAGRDSVIACAAAGAPPPPPGQ
jgi:hypothetical protein